MAGTTIKSTVTTLRILQGLKELEGSQVGDLADHLNISKPTIHHHLSTLMQEGYIVKEDGQYCIGLRFLELGARARNRRGMLDTAEPEIRELAEKSGELANLSVMERGDVVYLYLAQGREAMPLGTHTGKRVKPHCSAAGKAMLAHLHPEEVERILTQKGLPKLTENTITDREELSVVLEGVRERGFAFDRQEVIPGLSCVAAPITDADGWSIGAVSVSVPANRLRGDWFDEELPQLVTSTRDVIELSINFS